MAIWPACCSPWLYDLRVGDHLALLLWAIHPWVFEILCRSWYRKTDLLCIFRALGLGNQNEHETLYTTVRHLCEMYVSGLGPKANIDVPDLCELQLFVNLSSIHPLPPEISRQPTFLLYRKWRPLGKVCYPQQIFYTSMSLSFKLDNTRRRIKALETQLAEAERSYERLNLLFQSAYDAETKCHFIQIRIACLEECNRSWLKEIDCLGGSLGSLGGSSDKSLSDNRSM